MTGSIPTPVFRPGDVASLPRAVTFAGRTARILLARVERLGPDATWDHVRSDPISTTLRSDRGPGAIELTIDPSGSLKGIGWMRAEIADPIVDGLDLVLSADLPTPDGGRTGGEMLRHLCSTMIAATLAFDPDAPRPPSTWTLGMDEIIALRDAAGEHSAEIHAHAMPATPVRPAEACLIVDPDGGRLRIELDPAFAPIRPMRIDLTESSSAGRTRRWSKLSTPILGIDVPIVDAMDRLRHGAARRKAERLGETK